MLKTVISFTVLSIVSVAAIGAESCPQPKITMDIIDEKINTSYPLDVLNTSSNERYVAISDKDRTFVRDLTTRKDILIWAETKADHALFSKDGQWVVVTKYKYSQDQDRRAFDLSPGTTTVRLFNLQTHKTIEYVSQGFIGHVAQGDNENLVFSPTVQYFGSMSNGNDTKIVNLKTAKIMSYKLGGANVNIQFSSVDKFAFIDARSEEDKNNTPLLVNLSTGNTQSFKPNYYGKRANKFSPDGNVLAVSNPNGMQVLDIKSGQKNMITLPPAFDAQFSPNSEYLGVLGVDSEKHERYVVLIRIADAKEITRLKCTKGCGQFSFSPDSKWLATAPYFGNSVNLLNLDTLNEKEIPAKDLSKFIFSPDSQTLVLLQTKNWGRAINLYTQKVTNFRKNTDSVQGLAFLAYTNYLIQTGDRRYFFNNDDRGSLKVIDTTTGKIIFKAKNTERPFLKGNRDSLTFVHFIKDYQTAELIRLNLTCNP